MRRELLIGKVMPLLIFFSLWLDGWFLPLLLLPFLYVVFVERRGLWWLGFWKKDFMSSIFFGLLTSVFSTISYYPIFLYYFPIIEKRPVGLYDLFTDVAWYPLYEEVAYRSFLLVHFANFDGSAFSKRNLVVNLSQSFLFLSIHWHHITSGLLLVLVPVFLLALLNGFVFLKTRNIIGCILSHSAVNSFALLLHYVYV